MCSVIWMTVVVLTVVIYYVLSQKDVSFDYRKYACDQVWNDAAHTRGNILGPLNSLIGFIFPNVVMMMTTIPTIKYLVKARKSAKRTKKSAPWHGALTVVLTTIIYCVLTLPLGVYSLGQFFVEHENRGFNLLYRYAMFLAMANVPSNFFVDALAIPSFRRYLKSKFDMIASKSKKIADDQ